MEKISLACGNGARENAALINEIFMKYLKNPLLEAAGDAAVLGALKNAAFSTDSYTISPRVFKGGDIGKLSICGTCNDLAMQGARPLWLSAGFVIEEGFSRAELEQIAASMAAECAKNGAQIVTADTKVVPRGSCDGIFINTSGIGEIVQPNLAAQNIQNTDAIVLSGPIGAHGAAIFAAREGVALQSELESDCASLWPGLEALFRANLPLRALRDATRGGLAAVANEFAQAAGLCLHLREEAIAVSDAVRGICEFLGFEPYALANEGTFVLAVAADAADAAVRILRENGFAQAAVIGEAAGASAGGWRAGGEAVGGEFAGRVVLHSAYGTRRFLDMPSGELLPRIC